MKQLFMNRVLGSFETYLFLLKKDANGERDDPPVDTFSLEAEARAPGSLHLHRSFLGTLPSTCSTWAPQPAHEGLPQLLHVIFLHIPPRVSL
jgi:hypothetical protein